MSMTRSRNAFTLAEVLIALALLGIVAAFAVPKVLQSTQNSQRDAIFKEVYADVNNVLYSGMLTGEIYKEGIVPYLSRRLNAIKVCPTNYETEGCYPFNTPPNIPGAGFVLPNGAALIDFDNTGSSDMACLNGPCGDAIGIDWNGIEPPNQTDNDYFVFNISYGKGNYVGFLPPSGGTLNGGLPPGRLGPYCSQGSLQLFNRLFNTDYTMAANCP